MKLFFAVPKFLDRQLARVTIFLIRAYQSTFSPDHSISGAGNPVCGCKFFPSCSEYAILSLKKNGFFFGVPRAIWRVLRCNPWSCGGVDLPK
ncbi:membrane protein insertion efficiency factor YidD [bacterium]|nr:membrane protein insertion efficiency factor YidD [bacterium]MBT6831801.1 membrane protein insertion efficiency factor YidD [bacterium]MBT6996752.1 membrane protein insertion efficiency factor YidD [bacterium]MBT7772200.1 membrane protein insertion efficiency factor YidD [bacterium]